MTDDHALETNVDLTFLTKHIFVLLFVDAALLRLMTNTDLPVDDILYGYNLMTFKDDCQILMTIQTLFTHVVTTRSAEWDSIFGETCMQCILDASLGQHSSLHTWRGNRLRVRWPSHWWGNHRHGSQSTWWYSCREDRSCDQGPGGTGHSSWDISDRRCDRMKSGLLPRRRYQDIVDTSGSLESLELSLPQCSQPLVQMSDFWLITKTSSFYAYIQCPIKLTVWSANV